MTLHHPFIVSTLGSGSRGNSTFIGHRQRGLLIDCGLSTKQIMKRMEQIGAGDTPVSGVLLTHEHSDHVGAARILEKALSRKQGHAVPFFMTPGTARNLPASCRPNNIIEIHADRPFRLEHWLIEPLSVPHDTSDPVAYTVQSDRHRVGVLTDFGHVTNAISAQLATLDIAILEFNHDIQMLIHGPYPMRLKDRVRGPHGHLSNQQAADLIRKHGTKRLKHIILAHLSQDNNTIDKAYLACQEALSDARLGNTCIHVGSQARPIAPIVLGAVIQRAAHPTPQKSFQPIPAQGDQPSLFPDL